MAALANLPPVYPIDRVDGTNHNQKDATTMIQSMNLPEPPKGWAYTGEFRFPQQGEYILKLIPVPHIAVCPATNPVPCFIMRKLTETDPLPDRPYSRAQLDLAKRKINRLPDAEDSIRWHGIPIEHLCYAHLLKFAEHVGHLALAVSFLAEKLDAIDT
jgi:hypothetical protein